MKNVQLAHSDYKPTADAHQRLPRGLVVIGAALMSWLVLIGVGTAGTQIFLMIASHL